jgi:aspartyl-tRNA(Asn)/glutamyl-tRNA(Gln) amidotransferase subunit A
MRSQESPALVTLGCQWQFNVFGIPSISIPCGFTQSGNSDRVPGRGAPPFGEEKVLSMVHVYQQATDWHERRPPIEEGAR